MINLSILEAFLITKFQLELSIEKQLPMPTLQAYGSFFSPLLLTFLSVTTQNLNSSHINKSIMHTSL